MHKTHRIAISHQSPHTLLWPLSFVASICGTFHSPIPRLFSYSFHSSMILLRDLDNFLASFHAMQSPVSYVQSLHELHSIFPSRNENIYSQSTPNKLLCASSILPSFYSLL